MRDNQFLDTLAKISKKDFKEFYKYASNNYGKNSASIKILTYLKQFYPDFDRFELDPSVAFKKIFKGEIFSNRKLTHSIYDLRKYLKEFLIKKYFYNFPFDREIALKHIFEKLNLEKPASNQFKKMQSAIKDANENEMWFWMQKLRVTHENYFNNNLEKIALEGQQIKGVIENLDNFYALAKLKYACEVQTRTEVLNETYKEIIYLEQIMEKDWKEISLLHDLYQSTFKLISTREDQYYHKVKELVVKNKKSINSEDSHILITYLINHTAYHIKKGNQQFGKEAFGLFKYKIQDNSFIVKGFFDINHFVNIVDLSSALEEFKWCEEFINQYQEKLLPSEREMVLRFCFAILHFWKREFEESLDFLINDFKKNIFFDIKARLIRIACKYELNENTELILSECNATDIFTRRNLTAHESIKKAIINFIAILKQIMSFQPQKSIIKKQLDNGDYILYKSWLIKKIDEL